MIDWNEDNFLEKLTRQLRQKSAGAIGPCPDAETLLAVIEGEAREPERDAVIEHLSQCATCAELRSRLLNFESVSPAEPEAVWKQTRTRLDNWLEGFLRSEAAQSRSSQGGEPSLRVSGWESISNFFTLRRIVWALGVAVALVLIVDGALVLEYRRAQLSQAQVAARATAPPKPLANAAPVEKPEGTRNPKVMTGQQAKLAPKASPPPAGNATKAVELSAPTEAANLAPPPTPNAPMPSAPPDHNLPSETAQARAPLPPNPGLRRVPPPKTPKGGSMASLLLGGNAELAAESTPAAQQPPPRNATAEAISHPLTLRLDPASRLLIVLSSISGKPGGTFRFHGTLLLLVAHPGPVPLDRGAEVIGIGTRSQGQTSLAVTDLVVQGVRYTLKDGNGLMNAQTPGAGGGVDFDRSQLLDMRPMATAVYEKVSDQTGQPEPQK